MVWTSRSRVAGERTRTMRRGWSFIEVGAHLSRSSIALTGSSVNLFAVRASWNRRSCTSQESATWSAKSDSKSVMSAEGVYEEVIMHG